MKAKDSRLGVLMRIDLKMNSDRVKTDVLAKVIYTELEMVKQSVMEWVKEFETEKA